MKKLKFVLILSFICLNACAKEPCNSCEIEREHDRESKLSREEYDKTKSIDRWQAEDETRTAIRKHAMEKVHEAASLGKYKAYVSENTCEEIRSAMFDSRSYVFTEKKVKHDAYVNMVAYGIYDTIPAKKSTDCEICWSSQCQLEEVRRKKK